MAVIAVALALLVSWHLVAVGIHGMGMMVGLCFVALAVVALALAPDGPVLALVCPPARPIRATPAHGPVAPSGRHPPDEGLRLRH